MGSLIRGLIYTRKSVDIPIISVGNVNIGGTGKTPLTITLVQKLQERGHNPQIVTRGYGGKLKGPVLVCEKQHSVTQVGDEALLLSSFCKTWVAKNRYQGAFKAAKEGASIVILDDGHQNLTLSPNLAILVVDSKKGFGNNMVIPSGPLREPLTKALARADLIVAVGSDHQVARFQGKFGKQFDLPVISARMAVLKSGLSIESQNVVAFAGIGDPFKFLATLKELGAIVKKYVPLDDHEVPSESFLYRLEKEARKNDSLLVTTEKDAVRLNEIWKKKVLTVPVRMEISDWDLFDTCLQEKLTAFS